MAAEIRIFNPDTVGKPLGQYSQIACVKNTSELAFIAGQLASDKAGRRWRRFERLREHPSRPPRF